MAYYHVLLNGTGTNGDGSTWNDLSDATSAYIGMQGLTDAVTASSLGDTIYVKGDDSAGVNVFLNKTANSIADWGNPLKIIGVKAATTNLGASIVQSDLVPGLRTGDTTRAYDQTAGNAPPSVTNTGAAAIQMAGNVYIYGIIFTSSNYIGVSVNGDSTSNLVEECEFILTGAGDYIYFGQSDSNRDAENAVLLNCSIVGPSGSYLSMRYEGRGSLLGCDISIDGTGAAIYTTASSWNGDISFIGCDFSGGATSTLVNLGANSRGNVTFWSCQFPSSYVLTTGTPTKPFSVSAYNCNYTTGKTSGSVNDFEFVNIHGNVDIEKTAVRTDGADDGSGAFSYGMTPAVDGTIENTRALISPWMAFKITGDGTAQTVTVYIANSGSGDYNDDDVWLEIFYPSEGGTAQYDFITTQMELLDTPTAVTDDASSTWGTGGNNPQQLAASISPDYVGRAYCRVHFAKHFAASPETLYVDPLPVVS
jgi:hypothetical protein